MTNPTTRRLLAVFLVAAPGGAAAQTPTIDSYGYILDIEVPESPALVVLGHAPFRVLHANAPKPMSVSVQAWRNGNAWQPAVSLDVSPLYFAAGGRRTFESYTANSIAGRLMRVLTKTIVSIGSGTPALPGRGNRTGVAVRATFHDPHDPINNSPLVADLQRLMQDHHRESPEVRDLFTTTAAEMRGRRASMWSGGWGMAWTSDRINPGASRNVRHTAWLAVQQTMDANYDVLVTAQVLSLFGSNASSRIGAALRRKAQHADIIGETLFDTETDQFHVGVGIEVLLARRFRGVVTIRTDTDPIGRERVGHMRVLLRWSAGN